MKILWIEDFPEKGSEPHFMAEQIFKDFFEEFFFDKLKLENPNYFKEAPIDVVLPAIFKNYLPQHEIYVSKSYTAFTKTWEETTGDFDVVIIDINLISHSSCEKLPEHLERIPNFHEQAGLYIYHWLIKHGYPDENIAFLSAEDKTLDRFEEECRNVLFEPPTNRFEKEDNSYEDLRKWFKGKIDDEYLVLRRCVIDGCSFLTENLSKMRKDELSNFLIFFKTTKEEINTDNIAIYLPHIEDYLERLKHFFSICPPPEKSKRYYQFIKEVSSEWEMSQGYLNKVKHPDLPWFFFNAANQTMKDVRNWTSHNSISPDVGAIEAAFTFILAMRAFFGFDLKEILQHEQGLEKLIVSEEKEVGLEEVSQKKEDDLEEKLAESYYSVRKDFAKGKTDSYIGYESFRDVCRYKVRNNEKENKHHKYPFHLIYQIFWHSLFPATVELSGFIKETRSIRWFTNFKKSKELGPIAQKYKIINLLKELVLPCSFP